MTSSRSWQDVWYDSDDGLRLYARDYGNRSADLTALCMHGLTRNSADFEELAQHLQKTYRVVTVDQRGRGESARDPDPANYTPARYVRDMVTLIAHLELRNVVLIGTSMGGIMAMLMAASQPNEFRGIVLNDIGPVVAKAGIDRIRSYVGKSKPVASWDDAVAEVMASNAAAFPSYTPTQWQRWAERMYAPTESGALALRYDPAIAQPMNENVSNATPPELWSVFEALSHVPILLIRGELTDILDAGCAEGMQRRHPDLTRVDVSGVGHAPMLDEPGVTEAIDAFLAGLGDTTQRAPATSR